MVVKKRNPPSQKGTACFSGARAVHKRHRRFKYIKCEAGRNYFKMLSNDATCCEYPLPSLPLPSGCVCRRTHVKQTRFRAWLSRTIEKERDRVRERAGSNDRYTANAGPGVGAESHDGSLMVFRRAGGVGGMKIRQPFVRPKPHPPHHHKGRRKWRGRSTARAFVDFRPAGPGFISLF